MFVSRMVFFRLHESPRFLVHAGRVQEALESLQMISRFNGSELPLNLEDVDDNHPAPSDAGEPHDSPHEAPILRNETIFDADALTPPDESFMATQGNADFLQNGQNRAKNYHSTGQSPNTLDGQHHSSVTPATEHLPTIERGPNVSPAVYTNITSEEAEFKDPLPGIPSSSPYPPASARPGPRLGTSPRYNRQVASSRGTMYKLKQKVGGVLPWWIQKPLWAWLDRVSIVLSPEWVKTTSLMWIVWFAVSLGVSTLHEYYACIHLLISAYTMFNVFLPKLLETGSASQDGVETPKKLEDTLWDVVIFTLGGCPGSIVSFRRCMSSDI